jgi:hypothetical protein
MMTGTSASSKPEEQGLIIIPTNPVILTYLDRLVALGIFGSDRNEVARRLLEDQLYQLIVAGFLSKNLWYQQ